MNRHYHHNTTPNLVEEEFPSIVSKYYPEDGEDKCRCDETDDESTSSSEEEEETLRDMMMLDMVVHVEDIQSQLRDVVEQYQKFSELTEIWHEKSADYVKNKQRVQWIKDESKKRKAMSKMAEVINNLQEEMELLSLKSKDMFRDHHMHLEQEKQKMEAKERRRRKPQQKREHRKRKDVQHRRRRRHLEQHQGEQHHHHHRHNEQLQHHQSHQHQQHQQYQQQKTDQFKTTITRQQVGNSRRSLVAACA